MGVARGVEQALIEAYGFRTNRQQNVNFSHPSKPPPSVGIFSGIDPTLRNFRRSIEAKKFPSLYCASTNVGYTLLRVGSTEEAWIPPVRRYRGWNANFPGRDCSDVAGLIA